MMQQTPFFTIATITYNSSVWIRECISSILNSSFTDFELIISDDCSTDDTWDKIRQFADPRIKCIKQKKNLGEYKNRNFVLSQAGGKYFYFVDGDDVLYENTLRNLNEYITEYPSAISIWGIYTHSRFEIKFPKLLTNIETLEWIYIKNNPIALVGFAETIFKTEYLKKAGGFSEKFDAGDTYIKKKFALMGDILLIPVGLSYWRMTDEQASKKLSRDLLGYKNNVRIDQEIFADPDFKILDIDHEKIKRNISVRNIKLLISHTVLKGKLRDGFKIFREMNFKPGDLRYLLLKTKTDSILNDK